MTKIVFYKSNGIYWGFEEQGHTGYADEGQDILCAAISAMTMLMINAIEVAYESEADYSVDEDTTNIRLVAPVALSHREADRYKQYAVSGLIKAYYCQLVELIDEYADYLQVEEVERTAD